MTLQVLTDPLFYATAIPAVIILGLAKGGFSGIGVVAVPLMALAISPVLAASITLPILIVQDVVSVWSFRRTWDAKVLKQILPGAVIGVLAGYGLAAFVRPAAVELCVGMISILFALQRLRPQGRADAPAPSTTWRGSVAGVASGFTSQIAHAGGPPFQIYVLPLGLSRDAFIGTSSIFFAIVNWIKVPAYLALGQLTAQTLSTALVLLPLAIGSTFAGVWLIRRVPTERFYLVIYILLTVVGAKLVWDGAVGLLV